MEENVDVFLEDHSLENQLQVLLMEDAEILGHGVHGGELRQNLPENAVGEKDGFPGHRVLSPVIHKGIHQTVDGSAAEAVAFFDKEDVHSPAGGGDGGSGPGKSAACHDEIVLLHKVHLAMDWIPSF